MIQGSFALWAKLFAWDCEDDRKLVDIASTKGYNRYSCLCGCGKVVEVCGSEEVHMEDEDFDANESDSSIGECGIEDDVHDFVVKNNCTSDKESQVVGFAAKLIAVFGDAVRVREPGCLYCLNALSAEEYARDCQITTLSCGHLVQNGNNGVAFGMAEVTFEGGIKVTITSPSRMYWAPDMMEGIILRSFDIINLFDFKKRCFDQDVVLLNVNDVHGKTGECAVHSGTEEILCCICLRGMDKPNSVHSTRAFLGVGMESHFVLQLNERARELVSETVMEPGYVPLTFGRVVGSSAGVHLCIPRAKEAELGDNTESCGYFRYQYHPWCIGC